MSIEPTTAATSASKTTPPPTTGGEDGAEEKNAGTISSDFTTFLTLLTAQLQNQDPLNPMDSTQFVAQLAQFSSVEQQTLTNQTLGRIEAAVGGGGELTQWLGAEVEAPVAFDFDGEPVTGEFDADPAARAATIVVQSEIGAEIAVLPHSPGQRKVEWDGREASGAAAPAGAYRMIAKEVDSAGETTETTVSVFAEVAEARRGEDGSITLVFAGGDRVDASKVTAARRPDET